MLHCLRASRLQQLLPCTDLRDTEHFRHFFRWAAQQNTALQGHILAPLLQQLLINLRCLFKGLRPLRIKGRFTVDILRARTLQIIQLPGDIVCLQRLPHPALQHQSETLLRRDRHRHTKHLQRREHLAAHISYCRAQQAQLPRLLALLPAQRLHQGNPAFPLPPGYKAQFFKRGQAASRGVAQQEAPQHSLHDLLFLVVKNSAPALQFQRRPFLLYIIQRTAHCIHHLFIRGGLHDIVKTAQPQCLLCIFELSVGCQEDAAGGHPSLPEPVQQIQPAFHGHFNIAEHDLGLLPQQAGLGIHSVQSRIHHSKSHCCPVGAVQKPLHHGALIVYDQQFHAVSPSFFCKTGSIGRNSSTLAPPPRRLLVKAMAACSP